MKYIRTKDGEILDTTCLDKYNWLNTRFIIQENQLIVFDLYHQDYIKNHGEVHSQAETIEELCDLFIVWNTKNIWCFWKSCHSLPIEDIDKVYGAIWTDKGLIYVAKMNEKGELELL